MASPALADTRAGVDAWTRGDFATAVKTWQIESARGDADAMFNLGQAYKLGKGVTQNLALAEALFGRALPGLNLPLAVRLFFANGGRRCVVVRCVDHRNVRTARLLLPGLKAVKGRSRRQVRIAARNPGSWGNRLEVRCRIVQRPLALGYDETSGAVLIPPDRPAVGATLRLLGHPTSPGGPAHR